MKKKTNIHKWCKIKINPQKSSSTMDFWMTSIERRGLKDKTDGYTNIKTNINIYLVLVFLINILLTSFH